MPEIIKQHAIVLKMNHMNQPILNQDGRGRVDLSRAEPEGPFGCVVLCEDGKHALHRPQNGSVDHDRPLVACLSLVLQVETNGQLKVQLHCSTLELAHEGVVDCDVNLWAIERSVAGVHLQPCRAV